MEQELFRDVMVLNGGHAILSQGSTPGKVSLNGLPNNPSLGLFKAPLAEKDKYDLENLPPFIEATYRLISACIVNKSWVPTDFSEPGLLEKSMPLLMGQSVFTDHNSSMNNVVGSVASVTWDQSFKQGDIVVPAGINGVLRIDAESNPKLARGILMDPPSVHSNSVTVTFAWKPSHAFKDLWEFYDKLGSYKDGEMVRRIVTHIESYHETSLVAHGADPFAQLISPNGKLNHIYYAGSKYYGSTAKNLEGYHLFEEDTWKRTSASISYDSISAFSEDQVPPVKPEPETTQYKEQPETKQPNKMDENLKLLAVALSLQAQEPTLEDVKAGITSLQEQVKTLNEQLSKAKAEAAIGTAYLADVRKNTIELYQKLNAEKTDENILTMLNSENTNLETLKSFNKMFSTQLEEKFPMACQKCGSKDVGRGSAIVDGPETTENDEKPEVNVLETLYRKGLQ